MKNWKPHEFSKAELVFPTTVDGYLPEMAELPAEFKGTASPACEFVSRMFYGSPPVPANVQFHAAEGISAEQAYNHLQYVLRSWEPKHERKMAGAAYLISIWFTKIVAPNEDGDDEVLWQAEDSK